MMIKQEEKMEVKLRAYPDIYIPINGAVSVIYDVKEPLYPISIEYNNSCEIPHLSLDETGMLTKQLLPRLLSKAEKIEEVVEYEINKAEKAILRKVNKLLEFK